MAITQTQLDRWKTVIYLTLYSIERFFPTFTSSYRIIAFGMTQSQIVAIIGLIISLVLTAWMPRKLNKQMT